MKKYKIHSIVNPAFKNLVSFLKKYNTAVRLKSLLIAFKALLFTETVAESKDCNRFAILKVIQG